MSDIRRASSVSNLTSKTSSPEIDPPTWLKFTALPTLMYASVLIGFLVGTLNFSILWCFLFLWVVHSFVYGEINRLKRSLIFSAQRESANQLLSYHSETVEWLNHILTRFWIVYSPVLSEDLQRNIDLVLESACPSFLESLRLNVFTLGSTPPIFSNAQVYPSLEPDLISLDLDIGFEPLYENDSSVSSGIRIELVAKLIKVDLPVKLKDLYFSSKVNIYFYIVDSAKAKAYKQLSLHKNG